MGERERRQLMREVVGEEGWREENDGRGEYTR